MSRLVTHGIAMQSTRSIATLVAVSKSVVGFCFRRISLPRVVIALTLLTAATVADAQAIAPVGALHAAASTADTLPRVGGGGDYRSGHIDLIARIGLGVVGTVGGVFAGTVIGAGTAQGCHGEECALGPAVLGAAVGAILGSAIIAGAPDIGSKCDALERIGEGAAAALIVGILGGVIGNSAPGTGVLLGFTAGTSIGAGLGASICR